MTKYIFLAFQVKSDQEFIQNSVRYLFTNSELNTSPRPVNASIREVISHLCYSSRNISDFVLHTSWVQVFVSRFASNVQIGTLKFFFTEGVKFHDHKTQPEKLVLLAYTIVMRDV